MLFPGQGAQFVGMGADLFGRHPDLLGPDADAVLGWSLADACLEGPLERLTDTEVAQPALFAVALATFRELDDALPDGVVIRAAAGHSLGEYTALVAAGALDSTAGLRLVAARGRAMAAAAAREPSGMAALIGADEATAEAFAEARRELGGRLWVANVNAPGQVVVAGGVSDLEWATATARDHGIRRVIPLEVAGAFHTPFMAPAADDLEAALDRTPFATPAFGVWANLTAEPHEGDLPGALAAQLTGRVRFADCLRAMAPHVDMFVHVGPGDVTAGMARRTVPETPVAIVDGLEAVEAVVARLGDAA